MNLIFSSDNNFAQHLGVALCSLLENNRGENINIYVIDGGIDQENKNKFTLLENKFNFKTNYIKPDRTLFKDVYISGHITEASYYRLSIGELLPISVDKAIYLDCDIVVLDNIKELWNTDLDNNIIGAITEAGLVNFSKLGIKSKENYFNAGILLIDLIKWREQNISKKCFAFIKQNPEKIKLHDQDTLNGVFCGQWKKLDNRFNLMSQVRRKVEHPIIIHFNTEQKPWKYTCKHRDKLQYYKYLALTPWINFNKKLLFFLKIPFVFYYITGATLNQIKKLYIERYVPESIRDVYWNFKKNSLARLQ